MTQLIQTLLAGLTIGSIYSLTALGFTIVFNATKVTNFANGDFVMMGGLISAGLTTAGWPILPSVLVAVIGVAGLAAALNRFGIQNARRQTILSLAMITIGFSVLYRGLMQVVVGRDVLFVPAFGIIPDVRMSNIYVSSNSLWVFFALVLTSCTLSYLFVSTRVGKAMRAVSQNPRAAALCGINPELMSMLAFVIAGMVGGIAGALVAPIGAAFYDYGLVFGLKGFAAAILGGFGSPVGAIVGGLIIGITESLSAGYLASAYKDAVALSILVLLLLVWPSGILGRVEVKRV